MGMAIRSGENLAEDLEPIMSSMKEGLQTIRKELEHLIKLLEEKSNRSNKPWQHEGGTTDGSRLSGKRLEISMFDGTDLEGWILETEQCFTENKLSDVERIEVSTLAFKGDALRWFRWENSHRPFKRWDDLKHMMLRQFKSTVEEKIKVEHHVWNAKKFDVNAVISKMQAKTERIDEGRVREQTQKQDQDPRVRGRLIDDRLEPLPPPSPLPSSPATPLPLTSFTLESMVFPLSSRYPSSSVAKKVSIVGNPVLVCRWPKPNPVTLKWPWPKIEGLLWPKPLIDLSGFIKFKPTSVSTKWTTLSKVRMDDDRWKLPQPLPPPPPLPPPAFKPPPPPQPALPPLALNSGDLEEFVKLQSHKFIKKLDGEIVILDVSGATIGEPNQRGDVHVDSVVGFITPRILKVEGINEQKMVFKDSGASGNFILIELGSKMKPKEIREYGVTGESCVMVIVKEGICTGIVIYLHGIEVVDEFLPIELVNAGLILGVQWLQIVDATDANRKTQISSKYVSLKKNSFLGRGILSLKAIGRNIRLESYGLVKLRHRLRTGLEENKEGFNVLEGFPVKVKAIIEESQQQMVIECRGFIGLLRRVAGYRTGNVWSIWIPHVRPIACFNWQLDKQEGLECVYENATLTSPQSMAEFELNKAQRPTSDSYSYRGRFLHREVNMGPVASGPHVLFLLKVIAIYTILYKGYGNKAPVGVLNELIVGSLGSGVKGIKTSISVKFAPAVVYWVATYFNYITTVEASTSSVVVNLVPLITECTTLLSVIWKTSCGIGLMKENGNQWNFDRQALNWISIFQQHCLDELVVGHDRFHFFPP